jgi:hypothetical protein
MRAGNPSSCSERAADWRAPKAHAAQVERRRPSGRLHGMIGRRVCDHAHILDGRDDAIVDDDAVTIEERRGAAGQYHGIDFAL